MFSSKNKDKKQAVSGKNEKTGRYALDCWSSNAGILNNRHVRHLLLRAGTFSYHKLVTLMRMMTTTTTAKMMMMVMMIVMMVRISIHLCDKGSLIGVRKHYHSLGYSRKL